MNLKLLIPSSVMVWFVMTCFFGPLKRGERLIHVSWSTLDRIIVFVCLFRLHTFNPRYFSRLWVKKKKKRGIPRWKEGFSLRSY